jgi:hypothetical protein
MGCAGCADRAGQPHGTPRASVASPVPSLEPAVGKIFPNFERGAGMKDEVQHQVARRLCAIPPAETAQVERARLCREGMAQDWTPSRDEQIVAAAGRYRYIRALADGWGLTSAKVLARWHQLRVKS